MSLPASFRSVVVARHLLGLSERQTAEALDLTVGTVKSRLSRGLTRLRQALAEPDETEPKGDTP